MEEFKSVDIKFENDTLNELVQKLNECFYSQQNNFVSICVGVHKIWAYCRGNYYKANNNEHYNSHKLLEQFGFDKKAVSRYKLCYEKFIDGKDTGLFRLNAIVYGFSPSKLFELLVLSKETIISLVTQGFIKPDMTVKQIREYIKIMRSGNVDSEKVIENFEIDEEDIPPAYNPNNEYEFAYFETKTKNQLLNIVWELQKAYQKLKLKGAKQKKI